MSKIYTFKNHFGLISELSSLLIDMNLFEQIISAILFQWTASLLLQTSWDKAKQQGGGLNSGGFCVFVFTAWHDITVILTVILRSSHDEKYICIEILIPFRPV